MEPGEDHHVSLVRLSLPVQFDLEGLDVGYRELPDLEGGAEDGALKSTASWDGLVGVQGGVGNLVEHTLNGSLDGWHSARKNNSVIE